tara:strand:+ start:658 stop:912 length:255 start_codon:yes stop_codon:yes gene_type:complete
MFNPSDNFLERGYNFPDWSLPLLKEALPRLAWPGDKSSGSKFGFRLVDVNRFSPETYILILEIPFLLRISDGREYPIVRFFSRI